MQDQPTYKSLQARWERNIENFPDEFNLRMRRALSWLGRAECEIERDDSDAAFIFYWIAFNAAYAAGKDDSKEREKYLEEIINLDNGGDIHALIRSCLADPIGNLLISQFVFERFWKYYNTRDPEYEDWEARLNQKRKEVSQKRTQNDTESRTFIVKELFDRLNVLRNQLIHGEATWKGSKNRGQVGDGARIMNSLVPRFLSLMMDYPCNCWGKNYYPLVGTYPHVKR